MLGPQDGTCSVRSQHAVPTRDHHPRQVSFAEGYLGTGACSARILLTHGLVQIHIVTLQGLLGWLSLGGKRDFTRMWLTEGHAHQQPIATEPESHGCLQQGKPETLSSTAEAGEKRLVKKTLGVDAPR